MTDDATPEEGVDEYVSKRLGVPTLHQRIDYLAEQIAAVRKADGEHLHDHGERLDAVETRLHIVEELDLEAALRAHDKRLLAHRERLNALDDRIADMEQRHTRFAKSVGKQGTRIGTLEERVLHAWPPASDIEERLDYLRGETDAHCRLYEHLRETVYDHDDNLLKRLRLWLYALAGSQAALGLGLLAKVLL